MVVWGGERRGGSHRIERRGKRGGDGRGREKQLGCSIREEEGRKEGRKETAAAAREREEMLPSRQRTPRVVVVRVCDVDVVPLI